jgi:hypothetical protein
MVDSNMIFCGSGLAGGLRRKVKNVRFSDDADPMPGGVFPEQ